MPRANAQLHMLYDNYGELESALERINESLQKLYLSKAEIIASAKAGYITEEDFDNRIADFIRIHIAREMRSLRYKGMRKARSNIKSEDIGAASSAIMRRTYADRLAGNINIASPGKRMSRRHRKWKGGHQRDWSPRTETINKYYGPDRAFILRILESGRDEYMAQSYTGRKGRGSRATWGRRGALSARGFFTSLTPELAKAAQRLGQDVEQYVKNFFEAK